MAYVRSPYQVEQGFEPGGSILKPNLFCMVLPLSAAASCTSKVEGGNKAVTELEAGLRGQWCFWREGIRGLK